MTINTVQTYNAERHKARSLDPAWLEKKRQQSREYVRRNSGNPEFRMRRSMAMRKYHYGITEDQFQTMLLVQCGKCAICQEVLDEKICVDHDHETGLVRGLLCDFCNTGLARFKEIPDLLRVAANYLEG
jgi:Recombination endonuclease VII